MSVLDELFQHFEVNKLYQLNGPQKWTKSKHLKKNNRWIYLCICTIKFHLTSIGLLTKFSQRMEPFWKHFKAFLKVFLGTLTQKLYKSVHAWKAHYSVHLLCSETAECTWKVFTRDCLAYKTWGCILWLKNICKCSRIVF